jgi:ABC-type metal ion transport system substrate-binding protein
MQIDYTAKRSLVGGHSVDTPYTITIGVEVFDRSPRWTGQVNRALSGNAVTLTHEFGHDYSITTIALDETDPVLNISHMREFLESVRLGETFQIDGQDATISDPSGAYSESHIGYVYKQFSFSVRIL